MTTMEPNAVKKKSDITISRMMSVVKKEEEEENRGRAERSAEFRIPLPMHFMSSRRLSVQESHYVPAMSCETVLARGRMR